MEKEVVITEASTSLTSSSFTDSRIICRVCQKQFSQYTCPRCNTRYCSLHCYKNHSLRCTESFMRDNVTEEMKQIQPEEETKKKMLDILKRFHSLDQEDQEEDANSDNDDDDNSFSEELIQKVLSGEEIKLEDLTPEEIKKFKKSLISGELSKLIEPWTPWWHKPSALSLSLSKSGCQLITPLNPLNHSEPKPVSEIPPGPDSPLPAVSQLVKSEPSPFLAVHLVDVLYSYCFTVRVYNGDWGSDPFGSVSVFLNVSRVLGEDFRPESVKEALSACLEKTCSSVYKQMGGLGFAIGLIDDVIKLLELGRGALLSALCDSRRMVEEGERVARREKVGRREKGKLRGGERKVYFLMCWVNEQPSEVWDSLASLVKVERESLNEVFERENRIMRDERKMKPNSKVIIEEV